MKKLLVFIADGTEEVEVITVVDYLRRAEVEVDLVSVMDKKEITGAHGIKIVADKLLSEIDSKKYDAVYSPGGLPGAYYIRDSKEAIQIYKDMYDDGKIASALCAAPIVLDEAGLLEGKDVTSYPGFDKELKAGNYKEDIVVFDSNVSDDELVAAFRGTDNAYVGKLVAEKLADAIGKSGKIAVFSAQEKTESSQKRVEGFKEALADYEGISIVSELYTDKVKDMSEAMADVLERYPDLDGVFCTNEDVADMYLGLDKGENTPVMVGVDATSVQQKAITDGQELGTVSQDPYDIGYQTIIVAAQAMSTDPAQAASVEKNVLLEPKWIDASNIDDASNGNYLYSK